MKDFLFVFKYLTYRCSAKTAHGIHSPFVFNLYNEVLHTKGCYYAYDTIERLRKKLLLSKKQIDVTDLGAGKSGKRTISEIAKRAAKNSKHGQLLFRLSHHFKPHTILELGTSLGISTSYLAIENPNTRVITLEGCPDTANEAKKNWASLGLKNIELAIGNFDVVLPTILHRLPEGGCQFVFMDGNHRKEPTLRYFNECLAKVSPHSVFILDDIHWSDEMEEAWEEIKKHPEVTVTIDLFFLGLVFFRKEQAKENFILWF